eukprot:CAMPEP_0197030392 /NCGR_PEP_ID=MMETSP1384-20130603/9636_1 /TAXON_ID=29189 /ORGANISM="Ammonia sp." /LENGTH=242 /DNA_ID=CAMNT_0042459727 /DNA_START=368 /DNA_END=1096 /DNA_ORIENTATION=-
MTCVDDIDCVVNCYQNNACYGVTIIGPRDANLTINCNSNYQQSGQWAACQSMNIYAENSTQLVVNVNNAYAEFWANTVYTPQPEDPSAPTTNTWITCGIIGANNEDTYQQSSCTRQTNLYSVYGWQTVDWTYAGNASWTLTDPSSNAMHCGEDYLDSCSGLQVFGMLYNCADESSACYSGPTAMPTATPSLVPSIPPTAMPTESPLASTTDDQNEVNPDGDGAVRSLAYLSTVVCIAFVFVV